MALTTLESILLTFAILGSVHLLVTLLQSMDNEENDCREIMKEYARYKFFQGDNQSAYKGTSPYYH